MVNYANSKVYKIWSTQGNKIYIGSTTKVYLSQRMDKHRADYKRFKEEKSHFITSFKLFEEYGLDNCFIELIDAKECKSKDELIQLEGKYIREFTCVNKVVPNRTQSEREEYQVKYYKDHKEQLSQLRKQYYTDNKEHISEQMKEYRHSHKEQASQYHKKYKIENKKKLSEYRYQKYDCECGGKYVYSSKVQHLKTIKHCQFIESQNKLIQ